MPQPLLPALALVALLAGGPGPDTGRVAFGAAPGWDQATISWGLQAPAVPPTLSEDGLWVSFAITPGFYLSTGADSLLPLIERVKVDGEAGEVRLLRRYRGSSVSAEAEGDVWVLRVSPPASHKFWFVDLVDLGYSADISSWGTRDEIELWFPTPGAAAIPGGSHLLLSYAAKPGLKEGSALTVLLDGEPTATLSLAAGHPTSARISLANLEQEQLLGNSLGIKLIPYLYSLPGACDSLSTADDWFRLDRHSGLRYLLADTGPPTSLAEFFAPGPDAMAVEPANAREPADTEATLWLVAGIDRLDRVTRSLSIGPPLAGRRHIVVGTAASVAARAGDGESRWDLAAEAAEELAKSPEALGIARIFPTAPSLLVVVGRDAAGLREAVRFLLSDSARDSAQGQSVLVRGGPDPDPQPAVSSQVTFGDLGFSGFDLRGGSRWSTVMQLNRSALGSFPTGVEMNIAAVHSPVPEMDRAFLHVIVNDSLLASYSLGEEMRISPAPIGIPDYLLRRSNRIRFELEYSLFVKDCGGALPQMRLRIPPSGFFDVAGHRPPTTLTFDDFPEAFHRPLVLRLPADPTPTDLAIAAAALRSLQHLPGARRMLPEVVFGGWGEGGDDAEIWLVPQDSAQEALQGIAPLTPYPPFTVVGPPPAGELYAYRDGESVGVMQVFNHQGRPIMALTGVGPQGPEALLGRLDRKLARNGMASLAGMLAILPQSPAPIVSVRLEAGETVVSYPGAPASPVEQAAEAAKPIFFIVLGLLLLAVLYYLYSRTRGGEPGGETEPEASPAESPDPEGGYFSDAEQEPPAEEPGFTDLHGEADSQGESGGGEASGHKEGN